MSAEFFYNNPSKIFYFQCMGKKQVRIPLLSDKKSIIEQIEMADLSNLSVIEIKEMINSLITDCFLGLFLFDPGLIFYRGIKYDTKPMNFADIIYPPREKAKMNRASDENEQMFYCASAKKVPFYELFVNKGDKLVLTTWYLNKPILVNNIGYAESSLDLLKSNRKIDFETTANGRRRSEADQLVYDYLSNKFCQVNINDNKSIYKLTIAIASFRSEL